MTSPGSGRRRLVRVLVVLGTLFALCAGAGGTGAWARSTTVTDPVNNPAAVDVRSVVYADRENEVVATAKVRALGPSGSLRVTIGQPDSDVGYVATVTRSDAGVVSTKLEYVTNIARHPRRCAMTASWSRAADTVRVSVPHTCLRFGRFLTAHWIAATMHAEGSRDAAASRVVGRGDSPGCVSKGEFRAVGRGQLLDRVHARLDTAGRFGDGGAGGYTRLYKKCAGSGRYAIEYNGATQKVAAKFVVR